MAKIMLGCVAREVTRAIKAFGSDEVGLTVSWSQVGPGNHVGYSGLSAIDLESEAFSFTRWRDHAHKQTTVVEQRTVEVCLADDADCGFDGFMPDGLQTWERFPRRLKVEIGHGELRWRDHREYRQTLEIFVRACMDNDLVATHVSGWTGTSLRGDGTAMPLDRASARKTVEHARNVCPHLTFRAHNCDRLTRDELRYLRDIGVEEFNFAPEPALVVSETVVHQLYNPAPVVAAAHAHGGYRRWCDRDPTHGVHYVLEQFRPHVLKDEFSTVATGALSEWIRTRLEWLKR